MQILKMTMAIKAILFKYKSNIIIQYSLFWPHQTHEEHIPFHNVFPYRGRLYMQLNKQGSPPNKTFPRASLPRHIGCSKSGQFLQTVVYQAEIAQIRKKIINDKLLNSAFLDTQDQSLYKQIKVDLIFTIERLNTINYRPLIQARRETLSETCRLFLSCSLSGWTPWKRHLAVGDSANCESGQNPKIMWDFMKHQQGPVVHFALCYTRLLFCEMV